MLPGLPCRSQCLASCKHKWIPSFCVAYLWISVSVAGPGIFGHPIQGCSKWIIALWPGLCTAIPRMVAGPTDKSISFLQHGIWILRAIMDYVMLVVLAISALRLSLQAWLIAVRFLPRWSRLACSFFKRCSYST